MRELVEILPETNNKQPVPSWRGLILQPFRFCDAAMVRQTLHSTVLQRCIKLNLVERKYAQNESHLITSLDPSRTLKLKAFTLCHIPLRCDPKSYRAALMLGKAMVY